MARASDGGRWCEVGWLAGRRRRLSCPRSRIAGPVPRAGWRPPPRGCPSGRSGVSNYLCLPFFVMKSCDCKPENGAPTMPAGTAPLAGAGGAEPHTRAAEGGGARLAQPAVAGPETPLKRREGTARGAPLEPARRGAAWGRLASTIHICGQNLAGRGQRTEGRGRRRTTRRLRQTHNGRFWKPPVLTIPAEPQSCPRHASSHNAAPGPCQ